MLGTLRQYKSNCENDSLRHINRTNQLVKWEDDKEAYDAWNALGDMEVTSTINSFSTSEHLLDQPLSSSLKAERQIDLDWSVCECEGELARQTSVSPSMWI